jgi:basic membrane protein A and related proteins
MKRWPKLVATVAALSLFGAACGGDDGDAAGSGGGSASGDCSSAEVLCVGLVTDVGKVDDKSFNQSAWAGVQQAGEELGAQIKFIETVDSKDYTANIGQFLREGYDVIVTVGFLLGEATTIAAKDNPDVSFIGVDQFQGEELPNVAGLIFPEDQAGFMAGALAGLLTKSNKVGAVLGTDTVPPVVAFKTGWENGAKFTNPAVQLVSTYHPDPAKAFVDPEWGASTAQQQLSQGADIIFGAGGKTGNGALIEVAKKDGAYCVGVDSDQWETVPEAHACLVTSAMKLITPGVFDLIAAAKDGTMPSGNFIGQVGLADFHDFDDDIPADVKTKVSQISADVLAGKIPTGYNPGG